LSDIVKLAYACGIFAVGQTLVWFQLYSHFVWKWWENRPILAVLVYGVPAGILFWYGVKISVETLGEAWGARLLGFGMSYLTFPLLTWWLLGETMFTPKTLICVFLSFIIVGLQLFWRT